MLPRPGGVSPLAWNLEARGRKIIRVWRGVMAAHTG
jgi:hypothetical protein